MAPAVPQAPTPASVMALLPKLSDADADIRYMSLSDLDKILKAGAPAFLLNDYHTCGKTVECLLKTLDDQHGEVQNQAIKCLGSLTLKLPPDILAPLVEKLSTFKTTHSVDNSIPSTALRTFITSFPPSLPGVPPFKSTQDAYSAVSKVLIPRLVGHIIIPHGLKTQPEPPSGMLQKPDKGIDSDTIDVLIEVIRCFGSLLQEAEKKALSKAIMDMFDSERTGTVIKKKAVTAISLLAVHLSDLLLSSFVSNTIESFRSTHLTLQKKKLLINMIGSIARSVPKRIGPYLKTLAPFVLSALSKQEYEESLEEAAENGALDPELEEVREAALVALEGFLSSCSNDMRVYTDDAIDAALRYVNYDPNVATDEDDEEMGGTQNEALDDDGTNGYDDEEEEDFEEEGVVSDDDDSSWKVRRCAAKALYALISTRSNGDLLENGTLYGKVAPVLIYCFKEREENVRLEILMTLGSLIRKTGEGILLSTSVGDHELATSVSNASRSRKRRRGSSDAAFDTPGELSFATGMSSPALSPSPISGPKADLARLSPSIVRGVAKLLKQSSISTKQAGIMVLRDMVLVQHGGLTEHLGNIIDPLVDAIQSTASGSIVTSVGASASATGSKLQIEALQLVSAICDTHSSKVVVPYIGSIIPSVIMAVKDKYYKVSGQALSVAESAVKLLTPPRSAGAEPRHRAHLGNLYNAILDRAVATDADLEVRQRAIHALGVLLARTSGSQSTALLPVVKRSDAFGVLFDRLKNETTRLSAVQAVDIIAASSLDRDDLQPDWVRNVALELGAQLRKSDRVLRGASLTALRNLTFNPVALGCLNDKTVHELAGMLVPLLHASDLNLLGLAMVIFSKLVVRSPEKVVNENFNSALCGIVLAPLGGAVLDAFLALVESIGNQGFGQPLMHGLLRNVGVTGDPAIVGKAIGTLLVSGGSTVGIKIDSFVSELQSNVDDKRKCLALGILGEAGLRMGSSSPLQPDLFTAQFNSRSEHVPRAAAVALGRAGADNVKKYLPSILSTSSKSGSSQYLSLHAIKELLQYAGDSRSVLTSYTKDIWEKLLVASQAEDNKAVGAECIGRLTIIEPKSFLPSLQKYLQDPVPTVRGMVIQAVRFTLADSDDAFDEVLRPMLVKMLTMMLNDSNLENKRLALSALDSATHNKTEIILPHLAQLLPSVLKESRVRPELVREVQMGPFKHKVDDGLEVRKSAYNTLYSLMESAYTRINPADLFDRMIAGLEDEHEIKVLCNLMLTKLIVLDPEEMVRCLDPIAEHFRAILSFKPKDNAVKQEVEKANEASKGVLKVTVLLNNAFPGAASSSTNPQGQGWKTYVEWVIKDFRAQFHAMEQEVQDQAA